MSHLMIITSDGTEHSVSYEPAAYGQSLMEFIRSEGFDELEAICGGCCSCATCHVHVEGAVSSDLPPITEDEDDLLDGAIGRNATSRLSCQIYCSASLIGARIRIDG